VMGVVYDNLNIHVCPFKLAPVSPLTVESDTLPISHT
jgi:hypothetical protein